MLHNAMYLGILSGLCNLASTVPYVVDIFRGKTKPERAMWWIYAFLFGVLWLAQAQAGAEWLLIVSAEYVVTATLIAFLSIKYGYGRLHKRDWVSVGIAVLGIIIWKATDRPLLAILMVILVDFAGFWLTLIKTWYAPRSETLITWQMSFIGTILSLFSIEHWIPAVYLYPLYALLAQILIIWIIIHRRRVVAVDAPDV